MSEVWDSEITLIYGSTVVDICIKSEKIVDGITAVSTTSDAGNGEATDGGQQCHDAHEKTNFDGRSRIGSTRERDTAYGFWD